MERALGNEGTSFRPQLRVPGHDDFEPHARFERIDLVPSRSNPGNAN